MEIDTVGLSVPMRAVDEEDATLTVLNAGTAEQKRTGRRRLPGGGFLAWGHGHSVWVECSLPKRSGDDNVHGLPLPEALDVLEDLHSEVMEYVIPDRDKGGHSFMDATVKRVDLVRDFTGIASQASLLDGLAGVPLRGRVKRRRFADVERGKAETLTVGNSVWGSTLYDKYAESAGLAPPGTMRYEARMRSDLLTSAWAKNNGGHVRCLRDLEETKMRALRRGMFHRTGYDREVAAGGRVADLVMSRDDLSAREKRELWCYLTMPGSGADPDFGKAAAAKYRRLAEEIGVTPFAAAEEARSAVLMRLDYDSGREVIRAA